LTFKKEHILRQIGLFACEHLVYKQGYMNLGSCTVVHNSTQVTRWPSAKSTHSLQSPLVKSECPGGTCEGLEWAVSYLDTTIKDTFKQRQQDNSEASLDYTATSCLKQNKTKKEHTYSYN
jgi:hypothetical protein